MPHYPAQGQNPRYNKSFNTCLHAKTPVFFTRVYAGVLPTYPHDDFDVWIEKPGLIHVVMAGQPVLPPLDHYNAVVLFAQQPRNNTVIESKDIKEIMLQLSLLGIPVTMIGWDY